MWYGKESRRVNMGSTVNQSETMGPQITQIFADFESILGQVSAAWTFEENLQVKRNVSKLLICVHLRNLRKNSYSEFSTCRIFRGVCSSIRGMTWL